jgi:wobble nucleotide-excising tRNase
MKNGDVPQSSGGDRAWRIARWVIGGLLLATSVALLVLGGYAVHYAKEASAANSEQQTKDAQKELLAQVSKTALLVTQSQKVIAQAQTSAAGAKEQLASTAAGMEQQVSAAQASTKQTLDEIEKWAAQTTQLVTELSQSQKLIEQELSSISASVASIDQQLSQLTTTSTSTTPPATTTVPTSTSSP